MYKNYINNFFFYTFIISINFNLKNFNKIFQIKDYYKYTLYKNYNKNFLYKKNKDFYIFDLINISEYYKIKSYYKNKFFINNLFLFDIKFIK
jgi:hypothetical protein